MKKIILTIFGLYPLILLAQGGAFELIVKAKEIKNTKAYLIYNDGANPIIDSAKLINNEFRFAGAVSNAIKAQLTTTRPTPRNRGAGDQEDLISLYLENGVITVMAKDSLKYGAVKGSATNDEYNVYKKLTDENEYTLKTVFARWGKINHKDSSQNKLNDELATRYHQALLKREQLQMQFVKQYPNYDLSASVLSEVIGPIVKLKRIEPLYNGLSEKVKQTAAGIKLGKALRLARSTSVGNVIENFCREDIMGKVFNLADTKGKFVFLDFWASWCTPCRDENPYVVKAHNEYLNKNFIVVGISLDKDKAAWLKAIKNDGLPYLQIMDSKVDDSTVAAQYGISAIPQNFLIDPSGTIIARNLRGLELEIKLKEIFRL